MESKGMCQREGGRGGFQGNVSEVGEEGEDASEIYQRKGGERRKQENCCFVKVGKHPSFICRVNYGVSWKL